MSFFKVTRSNSFRFIRYENVTKDKVSGKERTSVSYVFNDTIDGVRHSYNIPESLFLQLQQGEIGEIRLELKYPIGSDWELSDGRKGQRLSNSWQPVMDGVVSITDLDFENKLQEKRLEAKKLELRAEKIDLRIVEFQLDKKSILSKMEALLQGANPIVPPAPVVDPLLHTAGDVLVTP